MVEIEVFKYNMVNKGVLERHMNQGTSFASDPTRSRSLREAMADLEQLCL
jgi:hypothetical protein